jgi:hypothetical protein
MHNNREVRRAVAQFLNGVAVAVLVAGAIGPISAGAASGHSLIIATLVGAAIHGLALLALGWR